MLSRLPTVRAKLTALVLLSVAVMLAALPVLSWLLHRQLVDEVSSRVTDAERAFQTELDDDLADLTLASRILADDTATVHAMARRDTEGARRLARMFVDVYPNIDVLLVEADGSVLGQVGVAHPPKRIEAIPELSELANGMLVNAVIEHGCETPSSEAAPAYAIGVPMATGSVIVCLPLDREYLQNSSAKLGLQLALAVVADDREHRLAGETPNFPRGGLDVVSSGATIVGVDDRSWAIARFWPQRLNRRVGKIGVFAALDVTDLHRIVRHNLLYALAALAVAASISVTLGWRLASTMSNALRQVNDAVINVEKLDYVHVENVRTGDELEDLARGFNRMVDGLKERDEMKTTFGKYLTPAIMNHLMASKVVLGGELLEVTVLFSDIRSFTSLSERMKPQDVVALLNEYFTEMVNIVMDEGGVVDKYIGDAIMAVFGAPVPKPGDAVHAVRAAVRMRRALHELNVRLAKRGVPALKTGIGIHTGQVVAGNIGSEKRMEYTVIGDTVNLASRLESSTKDLGVHVLISDETYATSKEAIEVRPMREITVKGRNQPVMTYEVLGLAGEPRLDSV